jgi:hypothetical protein
LVTAIPLFIALFLAQIYGAVTQHFAVPVALLLTLNLIVALILFETLLHFLGKRASAEVPAQAGPQIGDVIRRCLRVAVYIGVAATIAEKWIVDVIGLVDNNQWRSITHAAFAQMTLTSRSRQRPCPIAW